MSDAHYRGWMMGAFVEEESLRRFAHLEMKFVEVDAGWSQPPHFSKTATTVVIVLEGTHHKRIGGEKVLMERWDYAIIPPGTIIEDLPSDVPCTILAIRTPSIPTDRQLVGEA
jgi:quercetin dioxygenase-like cupin family protein